MGRKPIKELEFNSDIQKRKVRLRQCGKTSFKRAAKLYFNGAEHNFYFRAYDNIKNSVSTELWFTPGLINTQKIEDLGDKLSCFFEIDATFVKQHLMYLLKQQAAIKSLNEILRVIKSGTTTLIVPQEYETHFKVGKEAHHDFDGVDQRSEEQRRENWENLLSNLEEDDLIKKRDYKIERIKNGFSVLTEEQLNELIEEEQELRRQNLIDFVTYR